MFTGCASNENQSLTQCYYYDFSLTYTKCSILKYGTGDGSRANLNNNCRVDIDMVPKWVQVIATSIDGAHMMNTSNHRLKCYSANRVWGSIER